MLAQTVGDLTMLNFQLSPPILEKAGLEAALFWLGGELRESHGLNVEIRDDATSKPLGSEARSVVFQAVRELLLNVAKHAGTKRVNVSTERLAETILISVRDEGVGFNLTDGQEKAKKGRFGLYNMQQRIAYLGGRLFIDSATGRGTTALIVMPLEQSC